jgi:hypothetical protein
MDHKNYNNVTNPKHYQFSKPCNEVRDVIRDRLNKCLDLPIDSDILYDYLNAIKYLLRWFEKNGAEDLRKARYCIDSMLCILENGENPSNQPTKCESSNDVPAVDLDYLRKALDDYHKFNIIGVYNTQC